VTIDVQESAVQIDGDLKECDTQIGTSSFVNCMTMKEPRRGPRLFLGCRKDCRLFVSKVPVGKNRQTTLVHCAFPHGFACFFRVLLVCVATLLCRVHCSDGCHILLRVSRCQPALLQYTVKDSLFVRVLHPPLSPPTLARLPPCCRRCETI